MRVDPGRGRISESVVREGRGAQTVGQREAVRLVGDQEEIHNQKQEGPGKVQLTCIAQWVRKAGLGCRAAETEA